MKLFAIVAVLAALALSFIALFPWGAVFVSGEENWLTLTRDPHHLAFEVITGGIQQLVIGVLGGAVIWPRIKAHIHRDINKSHGEDTRDPTLEPRA